MNAKHTTNSKFYKLILGQSALQLLLIALINFIIDPYTMFSSPTYSQLNAVKPTLALRARLFRALDLERKKPTTIILGSSRAALGLNPDDVPAEDQSLVYNSALDGANMFELNQYFQHALANQPRLKRVILGLDLFMFSSKASRAADFRKDRLGRNANLSQDYIESLITIDALIASIKTVVSNISGETVLSHRYYLNNGQRNASVIWSDAPAHRWMISLGGNEHPAKAVEHFSTDTMSDLSDLINTCRAKNIELLVFMSPSHALDCERMAEDGRSADFEKLKVAVSALTPFWDFSGYNSVTTEAINPKMLNFFDAIHYTPLVGTLILQRLFKRSGGVPEDFGIYCSSENISSVLNAFRQQRREWRLANPSAETDIFNIRHQAKSGLTAP